MEYSIDYIKSLVGGDYFVFEDKQRQRTPQELTEIHVDQSSSIASRERGVFISLYGKIKHLITLRSVSFPVCSTKAKSCRRILKRREGFPFERGSLRGEGGIPQNRGHGAERIIASVGTGGSVWVSARYQGFGDTHLG